MIQVDSNRFFKYQLFLLSWKINMEPKNHLIEKDNHLLKPPFLGSSLTVYGIIELICDVFIWSVKCSPLRYH